jgi:protein-L-isoaspartate O-methyltransferase
MPAESLYDRVLYATDAMPQTHPDRLATLAFLFGMSPAAPANCRVIELGCGDGANLIPMAAALPGSRFTGIDLARVPIEAARRTVSEIGLPNCTFHALDISTLTRDFGEFDYIMAHGVYSWTPPAVRDALLRISSENLAPQGVAYVSYNALPGCHMRAITRDMMLYHAGNAADPEGAIGSAHELVRFLLDAEPGSPALREELQVVGARAPFALFHDDLAGINQPVYFHQFIAHARRHGLDFLAEAQFSAMQEGAFAPATVERIREFARGDRVRTQQYIDFLKCRRFRQTLLCHAGVALTDPPQAGRVEALLASSPAAAVSDEEFRAPGGASVRTNLPFVRAALLHLAGRWPAAASFDELAERSGADRGALAELLLRTYASGLIELHASPWPLSVEAGERPRAFSVARWQAGGGRDRVATLRHSTVEIKDAVARELIRLLDGTRDRAALLRDLQPACSTPLRSEDLDGSLAALGRLALLES